MSGRDAGGAASPVDVTVPLANEVRGKHRTGDGVVLRVLSWPVEKPLGRIQLVHGRGEHLGRYRELVAWLNRAGFSVFGHEHRNHGESGGDQGVPGAFGHLVDDAAAMAGRADELAPGPGRPVLLGHSLGGLVAIRLLQELDPGADTPGAPLPFSAAVISAPWLRTAVEIPPLTRLAIPVLRLLAPGLAVPQKLRSELLTRDPERARLVEEDPMMLRGVAIRFFDEAVVAQERALAGDLPAVLPALVLIPGADRLVDPEATRRWAAGLDGPVEVWELPETRHEPFNDVGRNIIFERLVEWLHPLFQREREGR